MVRDRKVLLFVVYRVQKLYKTVSESSLSLTDVEEATSGAADAVDQVDRCAGERYLMWKPMRSVRDKRQHFLVVNHFYSNSHSLGDMSMLGLLQCHNNTTRKLEEENLIFCLGSLQANGLNIESPFLKSAPPPA
eukprot:g35537.t1